MRGGRCATVEPFSYSDREASIRALHGVQTLFMVSASESADRLNQHRAVINAAAEAGVNHVVYTSFAAAAPNATLVSGDVEAITGTPPRSFETFLREMA